MPYASTIAAQFPHQALNIDRGLATAKLRQIANLVADVAGRATEIFAVTNGMFGCGGGLRWREFAWQGLPLTGQGLGSRFFNSSEHVPIWT